MIKTVRKKGGGKVAAFVLGQEDTQKYRAENRREYAKRVEHNKDARASIETLSSVAGPLF